MDKNDKKDLAKWLADTTPVVVGFGVSQVAAHHGADGYVASGFGLLAARLAAVFTPSSQRRLEPWLRGMLGGASPEEQSSYWERVAAREAAQEAVFVAADRLRSIFDPAAAEVLGRLTAEYVEADRFPDAFFRDFAALLTEIQGDELQELTSLCMMVAKLKVAAGSVRFDLTMGPDGAGKIRFWKVRGGSGQVSLESILGTDYKACDATRRLLGLLANSGLVERFARGETTYVDIPCAEFERVTRLVVGDFTRQ